MIDVVCSGLFVCCSGCFGFGFVFVGWFEGSFGGVGFWCGGFGGWLGGGVDGVGWWCVGGRFGDDLFDFGSCGKVGVCIWCFDGGVFGF